MIAGKPGAARRGKAADASTRVAKVVVEEDERRHLVEDCAFFRAARFRAASPGSYREQDLRAAAAAIDAAIRPDRKPRKRP